MISRRLSIRPTLFLFLLASLCLYFFNPLSPDASSFPYVLNSGNPNSATKSESYTPQPTASINAPKIIDNQSCQKVIDPEEDDQESFPGFMPGTPEYVDRWVNDPRMEDYAAQLSNSQKKLLDSMFDGNDDDVGDGFGGGKDAKWSNRNKFFHRFYNLGTNEDWRNWYADLNPEDLPPLTKFTQEYLFRHQNPPSCKGKKFVVMNAFPSDENFGLGAIVTAIATTFSLAIRTDRILVYNVTNSPGAHFISANPDNAACGRSFDCIFLPLSNCTLPDIPIEVDVQEPTIVQFPVQSFAAQKYYLSHPHSLPAIFVEALRRYYDSMPGVQPGKKLWDNMSFETAKYWWRSQASAYILRPKKETMEQLRNMRLNKPEFPGTRSKELNLGWECPTRNTPECKFLPMPFPLPRGSFSLHVRHGDKGIEMKLVDLPRYVKAAEDFVKRNPQGFSYTGFISTEDPDVLIEAKKLSLSKPPPKSIEEDWSQPAKWTWYWSDIPRLNVGPEEQLTKLGGGNRTVMTVGWMLQLVMALEADGWVGTRGSGWNRLIDQLRCVWVAGCRKPFLEVGTKASWKYYGP